MRDAHALSARFSLDPAYRGPQPDGAGLAGKPGTSAQSGRAGRAAGARAGRGKVLTQTGIFSSAQNGPRWVYAFGDLALHLFNRLRREAFATCCNVFHPGAFRSPQPTVHARCGFSAGAKMPVKALTLRACGQVSLFLNGRLLYAGDFTDPQTSARIAIRPHLRAGENRLGLIVCSLGAPATFLLRGGPGDDAAWEVSTDMVCWEAPEYIRAVGVRGYPHEQCLPEVTLRARHLGGGLYDFGVQTFGRPQVELASAGKQEAGADCAAGVMLGVGESVEETLALAAGQEQRIPQPQRNGSTLEWGANLALRYVRLTAPDDASVRAVRLSAPLYPVRYRGAFACSDDRLTEIWQRSAYTARLCMRQLFVDGLKRDRLPWGGDLFMAGQVGNYAFAEHAILQRSLFALYGEGPETQEVSGILDYSLFWILALREQYVCSGDAIYTTRMLPRLLRLLQALRAREDAQGFLPTRMGDWVFIDWCAVEKTGVCSCVQMLYAQALTAAADLCASLRQPGAAQLRAKAKRLRAAINRVFWLEAEGTYADNAVNGRLGSHRSRPPAVFAILAGVADAGRRRRLLRSVLQNPKMPPVATPYMQTFEALALHACGAAEAMLDRVRAVWGAMVAAGATTFWEGFNAEETDERRYAFYGRPFAKSLCHVWSAGPVYLLSQALSGARPLTPGWRDVALAPRLAGLDWLAVSIPCPQGEIRLDCEAGKSMASLPRGCTLHVNGRQYAGPRTVRF